MSRPRKPGRATKGYRDHLIAVLQSLGYKYTLSRKAVNAAFDIMKNALARKEPVEVPGGWWIVVRPARRERRLRLGRIVDIPKHPWRITLRQRPTEPLPRAKVKAPVKEPVPPPPLPRRPAQIAFVPFRRFDVPSRTRWNR